jgi:ATP-dependent RNA helicase DDX5/DBP2
MSGLGADLTTIDWSKVGAPKAVWPQNVLTRATTDRPKEEIDDWRKKANITIMSKDCPPPVLTYDECSFLPDFMHASFKRQGFTAPTAIQAQAWAVALLNRDVVGVAKTGSGKTLAFLAPGIVHILSQPKLERYDGPMMLVLAPTRELAKQIEDECAKVTDGTQIRTVCAYGGTNKFPQKRAFQDGVHIAIGCPGRLIDLLNERATNLYRVSYLVMDEADRMLDMGFKPQISMICSQCRPERQTLMFSATWPREVQELASSYQRNYVRLHVGSLELSANADVRQIIMVVPDYQKVNAMMDIIAKGQYKKILIFAGTKRDTEYLGDGLRAQGLCAFAIHGDRTQQQRDTSLHQFRESKQAILVATDVAQRGLDIPDLDVVINYDFPLVMEDYVHRIGRTGRAGAKGDAVSFINEKHGRIAGELISILEKAGNTVTQELRALAWKSGYRTFSSRGPPPRMMGAPSMMAPPPPPPAAYAVPAPRYGEERLQVGKRERSPERRR